MNQENRRKDVRLKHRAKIRLTVPVSSQMSVVDMRDFSENGLFVYSAGQVVLSIGDAVEVQTTEFDGAPIQAARVVRIEDGVGVGLEFMVAASSPDV